MKVLGKSTRKRLLYFPLLLLFAGGISLVNWPRPVELTFEEPATQAIRVHLHTLSKPNLQDYHVLPYLLPVPEVAGISSPYGLRHHPLLNEDRLHAGVDFPVMEGTPVLAAANGLVVMTTTPNDSLGYGNAIVLAHDEWYSTRYAHLSRLFVKADQVVWAGDTIGLSGNTGLSTEAHLHYEVLFKGKPIDPVEYLPPLPIFPPTERDSLLTDTIPGTVL